MPDFTKWKLEGSQDGGQKVSYVNFVRICKRLWGAFGGEKRAEIEFNLLWAGIVMRKLRWQMG